MGNKQTRRISPDLPLHITQMRVCQEGTLLKHFFLVVSVSATPDQTTSFIVYEANQLDRVNTYGAKPNLVPVHILSRATTTFPGYTSWSELLAKRGKITTIHTLDLLHSLAFTLHDFTTLTSQVHQAQHRLAQPELPCRGFTELRWRAVHMHLRVALPERGIERAWGRVSHCGRITDETIGEIVRLAREEGKRERGEEEYMEEVYVNERM